MPKLAGRDGGRPYLSSSGCTQTATKADSEIFNKFGRSIVGGRCTMDDDDFVSDGVLELVAASLVVLCSSLLAIAFM